MSLFKTKLKLGKEGEQLVQNYLERTNWNVVDLSDNENFWGKDIDFEITKDNEKYFIEVKYDTRIKTTGNMFIENGITYNDGKYAKGWLHYTEANLIWYVDASTAFAFVMKLDELKKYIKEHKPQQRTCNDGYKSVDGYIIKPKDYVESGFMWQQVDLKAIY